MPHAEAEQLQREKRQQDQSLPDLRHDRRLIGLVLGSAVVQATLLLPIPLAIRDIFDTSIPNGDSTRLLVTGLLLIMTVVLSGAVATAVRHHMLKVVQANLADIRTTVAGALVHARLGKLGGRSHDDLRTTVVQDSLRYSSAVSTIVAEVLPNAITAGAVAVVLLALDPMLFGLCAIFMLPLVALHRVLGQRVKRDVDGYHDQFRLYSASVSALLHRGPITRVHGAQAQELTTQRHRVEELEASSVALDRSRSVHGWALQSVIIGSALALLTVGGLGVIGESRTLGELFAFYAGIAFIRPALDSAVKAAPIVAGGQAAHGRLSELAHLTAGATPEQVGQAIEFEGHLEATNLSFGYGDRRVLDGVNLELRPGTVTLLRGPNGAGKTTLVRLLCGLLEPESGRIEADGVDFSDLDLSTLRSSIGVVFQEALVAGTTMAEALTYGDHELDDDAVSDALAVTGLDKVVARHPKGLDTKIGAEGINLSGGEQQRLAIAQALVRRPRLLLLDEPTNHLDAVAVASVVDQLVGRPAGPAVLVVTHEDSRRFNPDQIIELAGSDRHAGERPSDQGADDERTSDQPTSEEQPTVNNHNAKNWCRAAGTVAMDIDDHKVIVDRQGEQMITLNTVGGLIWDALEQPSSLEHLVTTCADVFPDVATNQLADDVEAFVQSAATIGLVEAK